MADISHLPAECLLRIFDFLDHHKPTLTAASTVCRAWTAPAQSALFRRVDLHSTRQAEAYLAIKDVTRAKRLITRELELDLDRDGVRREALRELLAGQDKLTRLLVQTGLQSVPSAVLRSSDLAGLRQLDIDLRLAADDDDGGGALPFALSHLAIAGQHYPIPFLFALVAASLSSLTSLTLTSLHSPTADHASFFLTLSPLAPRLRRLTLLLAGRDAPAHPAHAFLRACTRLEHLEVYTITEGVAEAVSGTVTSLVVKDSSLSAEAHVRLAPMLEHVREIRFEEMEVGDLAAHWGTWLACAARGVKLEFGR